MVEGSGIGKLFGSRWVFRRVEFSVAKGECLLVTGHNGAGKSTLLRIAAGLEPPSEGTMDASTSIGYSSPELRLYPLLTGLEHLELAARLRGVANDYSLLARVGLEDAADRPTAAYSTGMRARLKLALATQASPGVLILDEPGIGLDESGRALVEEVVSDQRTRGALIVATNDPLERRFGDLELQLGG